MKKDYDRGLELICPTCASPQLTAPEEGDTYEPIYICKSCEETFRLHELKDGNSSRINAVAEEIKDEVIEDFKKDLARAIKRINK
ncbi:hypothetical protein [Rhodosalinus sp. 5P4]|uniref:hypothetical protein n=1 Tax=Rhodosalinus sp. 5P4 TaxID=3239196 RepID=UPI00352530DD